VSVAALIQAARAANIRIVTAESCTGGMISAALTDIAGASAVLDRGFVTYSNAAKIEMLGVNPATLAACGAVSEEVAREMAEGALSRSTAQLAISVTGIAGPGGSDYKPEGRVCFGLALGADPVISQTVEFGALGRSQVRAAALDHALVMMLQALGDL